MLGIDKAAAAVETARGGAWGFIKLLGVALVAIGLLVWAHDHPEEWKAIGEQLGGSIAELVPRILDGLLRLLTWAIDSLVGLLPDKYQST